MTSQKLTEARRYEEVAEAMINPAERPVYHLTPRAGWMNDPNGFSLYQGLYHLFYQYNPYSSKWDTMHWGHAVSTDLLHWKPLPAALAPDQVYDEAGCYSGSAVELPDGRHLLMYTGVSRIRDASGAPHEIQTQNIAFGDGLNYEKYEGNPVLSASSLPTGASPYDFRDPKVWRRRDGSYLCAVANRPADGSGQILLYRSEDAFSWSYWKVLAANGNRYGKMWECPDFFPLNGSHVLLTSPQDMLPKGFEFHNGNGTLCVIGSFDDETGTFSEEAVQAIDYGIDFYAPQTIQTPDGRRVMIGWMQNWDACAIREPDAPWTGQMSMPRELTLKNGRLFQAPIPEMKHLRRQTLSFGPMPVGENMHLAGVEGRVAELEIELMPCEDGAYEWFRLDFAQAEDIRTSLLYRPGTGILQIDRKFCGSRRAIVHQRRCLVESPDPYCLKLHVFLDRFSCETFVNDGAYVLSTLLYTPLSATEISFHASGHVKARITHHVLG